MELIIKDKSIMTYNRSNVTRDSTGYNWFIPLYISRPQVVDVIK